MAEDAAVVINIVVSEYGKSLLEPELIPEFIKKIKARKKEKTIKITDFSGHYGLD
ncbi:MAG: hypothetical protein WC568_01450 [Candidatus Methanoperedens sp.]